MPGSRTRDSLGRWKPGQSGNKKGRPPREVEREYLHVTMEQCTVEKWAEITAKAVDQALAGDARAREWLARYLLGDPVQVHEYLFEKKEAIEIRVVFGAEERLPLPYDDDVVDAEVLQLESD